MAVAWMLEMMLRDCCGVRCMPGQWSRLMLWVMFPVFPHCATPSPLQQGDATSRTWFPAPGPALTRPQHHSVLEIQTKVHTKARNHGEGPY